MIDMSGYIWVVVTERCFKSFNAGRLLTDLGCHAIGYRLYLVHLHNIAQYDLLQCGNAGHLRCRLLGQVTQLILRQRQTSASEMHQITPPVAM